VLTSHIYVRTSYAVALSLLYPWTLSLIVLEQTPYLYTPSVIGEPLLMYKAAVITAQTPISYCKRFRNLLSCSLLVLEQTPYLYTRSVIGEPLLMYKAAVITALTPISYCKRFRNLLSCSRVSRHLLYAMLKVGQRVCIATLWIPQIAVTVVRASCKLYALLNLFN